MSIFRVWVPGEKGYKEHLDRVFIGRENVSAIKEQTIELKNSMQQQSAAYTDQTEKIIASNEQIFSALDKSVNRLIETNERGFSQVTSAIEDFHSDMCYLLGTIIQKLEYQNKNLNGILTTLQEPFETQVKEFYNNGCKFIRQENLDAAIEYFEDSIALKMGKYFFPSHNQLGRLYLSGKVESKNVTDTKIAMEYLLKATELGNGIIKDDPSFSPVLSDCKFFLSQSYYFQLTGKQNDDELELLRKAIKYCGESILLNPNLSQAYFHFAKYFSYGISKFSTYKDDGSIKLLYDSFAKAVKMDRNYLFALDSKNTFYYDAVFEPNKGRILELIDEITKAKRKEAENIFIEVNHKINRLEEKSISQYGKHFDKFDECLREIKVAEKYLQSGTYFGIDDCLKHLESICKS
jgi:tetratricopeptide (TPR) repeat protein